jgi:hypothetical protein
MKTATNQYTSLLMKGAISKINGTKSANGDNSPKKKYFTFTISQQQSSILKTTTTTTKNCHFSTTKK